MPRLCSTFLPLLFCALSTLAFGQQRLLVRDGQNPPEVVVAAKDISPVVLRGGKKVVSQGDRYAMVDGGSYFFTFVSMINIHAESYAMTDDEVGVAVNKKFRFKCDLESSCNLEDVFIVLLMETSEAGSNIFLFEVGEMKARQFKPIDVTVRLNSRLGAGRYTVQLFTRGQELFHSNMPIGAMDLALDRAVMDKIKGVANAKPQPLLGAVPGYPKTLRKKKVSGTATLSISIDAYGKVFDPSVAEASAPEFGEAAMEVIKQWRFIPKVVDGLPVACRLKVPFSFVPPKEP